jgi:hypothetical protein
MVPSKYGRSRLTPDESIQAGEPHTSGTAAAMFPMRIFASGPHSAKAVDAFHTAIHSPPVQRVRGQVADASCGRTTPHRLLSHAARVVAPARQGRCRRNAGASFKVAAKAKVAGGPLLRNCSMAHTTWQSTLTSMRPQVARLSPRDTSPGSMAPSHSQGLWVKRGARWPPRWSFASRARASGLFSRAAGEPRG